MTPKEELYSLLKHYHANACSTKTFCDQFTVIYHLELNKGILTPLEQKLFKELVDIATRYVPGKSEAQATGIFTSEKRVKDKAEEVYKSLIS